MILLLRSQYSVYTEECTIIHSPQHCSLFLYFWLARSAIDPRPALLRLPLRGPLACSSLSYSQLVSRFAAAPSLATFRRPLRNVDQTPLLSTALFSSHPELSALTPKEVGQKLNLYCVFKVGMGLHFKFRVQQRAKAMSNCRNSSNPDGSLSFSPVESSQGQNRMNGHSIPRTTESSQIRMVWRRMTETISKGVPSSRKYIDHGAIVL